MAQQTIDAPALETLLIQALTASDRLGYEPVGAHLATALDALRREARRGSPIPRIRQAKPLHLA